MRRLFCNKGGVNIKSGLNKFLFAITCVIVAFALCCFTSDAISMKEWAAGYSDVILSPDQTAWSVRTDMAKLVPIIPNEFSKYYALPYRHALGFRIYTGEELFVPSETKGEHLHPYLVKNSPVRVLYYEVASNGRCIHGTQKSDIYGFHNLPTNSCEMTYDDGYFAYCADCGEIVSTHLIYAGEESLRNLNTIYSGANEFYLCPSCSHLEQGAQLIHECRKKADNIYKIIYKASPPSDSTLKENSGFTCSSYHFYKNSGERGNNDIKTVEKLSKNSFSVYGYSFVGWNVLPTDDKEMIKEFLPKDAVYELNEWGYINDEAVICGLCDYDYEYSPKGTLWGPEDNNPGVVTLYAMWRKTESTILLDAGGGSFCSGEGEKPNVSIKNRSGEKVVLPRPVLDEKISVTYDGNGGSVLIAGSIPKRTVIEKVNKEFSYYSFSNIKGEYDERENAYTFPDANGNIDSAAAVYRGKTAKLPSAQKEGEIFIGWYTDKENGEFVGDQETFFTPQKDVVLYAHYGKIGLTAENDYELNAGKGAVRLYARDTSGADYYAFYKKEFLNGEFEAISNGIITGDIQSQNKAFGHLIIPYSSTPQKLKIDIPGIYEITAFGARGGNYMSSLGGGGGKVTGGFLLNNQDLLTFTTGQTGEESGNRYSGGRGTIYADGGGASIVEKTASTGENSVLMIAGGGGGALPSTGGGNGGSNSKLSAALSTKGQTGSSGGGGGYKGGSAGEEIVHHHSQTCYKSGTEYADLSFYLNSYATCSAGFCGYYDQPFLYKTATGVKVKEFFQYAYDSVSYNATNVRLNVGTESACFDTPGEGVLSFDCYWGSRFGGAEANFPSGAFWVYVYDSAGKLLLSDAEAVSAANRNYYRYDTTSERSIYGKNTVHNYSNASVVWIGELAYSSSLAPGQCYIKANISINIGKNTDGIYIVFQTPTLDGGYQAQDIGGYDEYREPMVGNVKYTFNYCCCGYDEGETERQIKSGGGSSFMSEDAIYHSAENGVNNGNGEASISLLVPMINSGDGFLACEALDKAPPDSVSSINSHVTEQEIVLNIAKPIDHGTFYYFKCEGYDSCGKRICEAYTQNSEFISGVDYYLYAADCEENTQINGTGTFEKTSNGTVRLPLYSETVYFHVAAADKAGNISCTFHYKIDPNEYEYPVTTDSFEVSGGSVYYSAEEGLYYVKADNKTFFTLSLSGHALMRKRKDYRVDSVKLSMNADNRESCNYLFGGKTENSGTEIISVTDYDFTENKRYDNGLSFDAYSLLSPLWDGKLLSLKGWAGAYNQKKDTFRYSDEGISLCIVGDAGEPELFLEEDEALTIRALDLLSGTKSITAELVKSDFSDTLIFESDSAPIVIDKELYRDWFGGGFTLSVLAEDNVGNVAMLSENFGSDLKEKYLSKIRRRLRTIR